MLFKMTADGLQVDKNPNCDVKASNKFPMALDDFLAWLEGGRKTSVCKSSRGSRGIHEAPLTLRENDHVEA